MRRMATSRHLAACLTLVLGLTLPLLLQGQWLPFTGQYKELTYRTLPNASVFAIPENYTIEKHPTIDTRPRQ